MRQGLVSDSPERCSFCGAGPFRARETRYHDNVLKETVVELDWCCSNCLQRFASGVAARIPDAKKQ